MIDNQFNQRLNRGRSDCVSPRNPNLLLFPLCDIRGALSALLIDPSSAYAAVDPDSIFFAWLLDLPANIAPALAARSLLQVAGWEAQTPPEDTTSRHRLYQLLINQVADSSPE